MDGEQCTSDDCIVNCASSIINLFFILSLITMAKQIVYGDDARKRIYAGMKIIADAVRVTM